MTPAPPKPTTADEARAWLTWAAARHHAPGCACQGCTMARRLLAEEAATRIGRSTNQ
jgi:hypothetical protein